jgi:hypothetical protein
VAYNGGQVLVHAATSFLENEDSKINDGIDAAKLLKQHEGHGEQKRLEDRSFQQLFWLDLLRIIASSHVSLQSLEFAGNVSVPIIRER